MKLTRTNLGLSGIALAAVAAVAAIAPSAAPRAAASRTLDGTFRLTPGSFSAAKAHGTYFRMVYTANKGYMPNPDSRARDKTYTLGRPGRDGGLATGRFQGHPRPPFTSTGSARANLIIKPEPFTSINFGVATLRKDPQSGATSAVTTARVSGRRLTVHVPGFTAEWNRQYFNQGAPKPDGSGAAATGTYDARSKHYVLTWTSKVRGGPFNGFSGLWHLEGTFSPR
ncbi:MAG: hypothetical protein QOG56_2432 [Solirubrobacteraceae bacterium]|jgi:hypothetical protein|nr:hypothetical protein [Solirubrobacteraceae bacterium]